MEHSNALLQPGGQSSCEKADRPAPPPKRGPDFNRAWDSHGHPLQLEEDMAVAGECSSGIGEGS